METFLMFVKAFAIGGGICLIGQVIIDFTHLTNGRILVIFLLLGAILQAFGLYQPLIEWAGAGASVPISGFGCALVKGAVEAAKTEGIVGAFTGGLKACATGITTAIFFGYLVALIFKPRTKQI
ncbi:MAG: stage V sporulation protein AE [Clostridiales bacterium]|nr:stage V sporulation protein AE [Eubacteriales bacterium]MCI7095124.1 stage V sporulation protein AE [Clostridiales bacterium]MDD6054520.1 stage V sporulation protein AE [Clostridiales bacterium]MDD7506062.1 stage V sporulation protein AE [Clostridiales bacterium]MDY5726411.1 stage V sporulation protein AE [Eubacteriales bacterium]